MSRIEVKLFGGPLDGAEMVAHVPDEIELEWIRTPHVRTEWLRSPFSGEPMMETLIYVRDAENPTHFHFKP